MTSQERHSPALPRRETVADPRRRASLVVARRNERSGGPTHWSAYRRILAEHRKLIRRIGLGLGLLASIVVLGFAALWWRLSSGPIQFDVVTPWLASAIEENFGSHRKVEVGGTQIERTANGGAAVRIHDIVVRDPDGTVVASAPKAEVRLSGLSLLSGNLRAESLNLVGAEMAVRIERNGDVTVFAGTNKRPIATATGPTTAAAPLVDNHAPRQDRLTEKTQSNAAAGPPAAAPAAAGAPRAASDSIAALLSWLDGIGETGLDGHDLRELGLKDGNLTVDDERTGKRWTFEDITLSIERPHGGGVVVTIGSDNPARRWGLTAAIKPTRHGFRSIQLEARQVLAGDLLLAARLGDGSVQTDLPLSASLRGEIGPDGVPQSLTGRIVADAGFISGSNDTDGRIEIDRAEFKIDWDAANHILSVPFQVLSGGNRITLIGQVEAPRGPSGAWPFKISGGTVVLAGGTQGDPLILNRIAIDGQYDPLRHRLAVAEGDIGNADVGVALSGNADYSSGDLRLTAGVAGTPMSADALRHLWPVFVAPKVRDWFNAHLSAGTVQHITIAVNAPFNTLKASGPPIPDDGLTLDVQATNCVVQPVAGLPALHDADLNLHIVGRDAQIAVGKATADLPSGKKLVLSAGLFEVPDTQPHEPPARVRFKIDGPVPAAAELLAMDRLHDSLDNSGLPFDPAAARGTMSAAVSLAMPLKADLPPGSTSYAIAADNTNFAADRMFMGQKVEAALLKVTANNQGFEIKGDVKIGGTPANLDYRKARTDNYAEVHLEGMLDENARNMLSLDPSNTISGSIPFRLSGRTGSGPDRDGRYAVQADLTPAQIEGFLPGWVKPAGKPARATFTVTTKPQSTRIDDLLIVGAGGGVKGTVELDGSGDLQSANFPAFGFSDGDRASLKVDRGQDGALHVIMRGEAYDGRGFVKSMTAAPSDAAPSKHATPDLDLDMRLGAVVGFNGEAVRGLDLKMSRRAGEIRSFGLKARIGRDAVLTGELRARGSGRQVVDLETTDAGALFRFTDVYTRMSGGQMSIMMDAPSATNPTQSGNVNVRNFAVRDEAQLQRAVGSGQSGQRNSMDFSSMKVDFTRMPGRTTLREGVVRGPVLGGTIDGFIDYGHDEVHLRGTLVPLYGPNNLLGQIPVVGLFLGGDKEGLLGVTYEVVGRPGNPVLHVNPLSALAPGILRKIFEFPSTNAPAAAPPDVDYDTGAGGAGTFDNPH